MFDNMEACLWQGLKTAYVNSGIVSEPDNTPSLVLNAPCEGKKVIASIEDELMRCDRFQFSVAFITMGGITPLLQTLKELEEKGVQGEILTTNYLNFSEPEALARLNGLSNVSLRMYDVNAAGTGFHTKGYIFKRKEVYRIIIGSSNITSAALTKNHEWNTKLLSTDKGKVATDIVNAFKELWNSEYTLGFDEFFENYKEQFRIIRKQREIAARSTVVSLEKYRLEPNSMQISFIANLKKIVSAGEDKALLISATGTGKTYASAFAARELGFKRLLFVVHRNRIAMQAKRSFENVFDESLKTGLIGGKAGSEEDYSADYVFSTVQTISKEENMKRFPRDYFNGIVYDESHHIVAESYRKLLEYFTPEFTLGMTATPDKRDDNIEGRNVYEVFNHNIAYEIRLQQAMEEDLLCPFHYFGIRDLLLIEDEGKTREEKIGNFRRLTSRERVRYIIDQANYYGYSGDRVKGLIFCSRIDEAKKLSERLNEAGFKTVALSGSDSEETRERAIDLLTRDISDSALNNAEKNDSGAVIYPDEDYLDYILTVDIFSEGTDIVEINQIIMLRPTQSPIVFVQQLGRGLRKAENKEYVVVLDFIGNYRNNFMIPIALSGDRSYNKDNLRRYIMEGDRVIPGKSTIHFDEISRNRIFAAVDEANFSDIKLIRKNYVTLKNKLGRIPDLQDFDEYGEMDVLRIFDNRSLGSYYKFLKKYEKDYTVVLSKDEEKIVEFISRKFASGKRIHELELLKRMLEYSRLSSSVSITHDDAERGNRAVLCDFQNELKRIHNKDISENQMENIVNIMTNAFPSGTGRNTYDNCIFLENAASDETEDYRVAKPFMKMLENDEFYQMLSELIEFGISRNKRDYSNTYANTDFVLYQKYTYEDVCRLLNWEHSEVPLNIGGYKYDKKTKTFPVFINYDKADDISDTIKYEDHFVTNRNLIAISKSGRSTESEDVKNFLYAKERGIQVELFVRKNKDDKISKEFYYLGHMRAVGAEDFIMANTSKSAVEIKWQLDVPVREDLYEYIVNG